MSPINSPIHNIHIYYILRKIPNPFIFYKNFATIGTIITVMMPVTTMARELIAA